MKVSAKLSVGFVSVFLLIFSMNYVFLMRLNDISKPLDSDIPQALEDVSSSSRHLAAADLIRYYDEVLTMSARNYAFTGDKKWEERYRTYEAELDESIKGLLVSGDEQDRLFLQDIDVANINLVRMEHESMSYVSGKKQQQAIGLLESQEYWGNKSLYKGALDSYVQRRGLMQEAASSSSAKRLSQINSDTEALVYSTKRLSLILSGISLLLVIALGLMFHTSISRPLAAMTEAINRISQGDMDVSISEAVKGRKDEVGDLACAFERTIVSLKLAMKAASQKPRDFKF
jgi:methyl-accepting chemotaxis protein